MNQANYSENVKYIKQKNVQNIAFKKDIIASIVAGFLFINFSLSNDYFLILYLLTSCSLVLFSSSEDSLSYLLFFSSFARVTRFQNSGIVFAFLLDFTYIISSIIKGQKISVNILIPFLAFISYCIITFEIDDSSSFATNLIQVTQYFILLLVVSNFKQSQLGNNLVFSISGFILASILGLLKPLLPKLYTLLHSADIVYEGVSINRFSGITYDTNLYALCAMTLISCIVIYQTQMKGKLTIFKLFLIALLSFGILTYSKMFFITGTILALLYVLFVVGLNINKFLRFLIVILILIFLIDYFSQGLVFDLFQFRFSSFLNTKNISDLTTNRTDIWQLYFYKLSSDLNLLFFGNGINNPILDVAAHNTFIELLSKFGIFGSIIFFIYLDSIIRCLGLKNYRFRFNKNIIPLSIFVICISALSVFTFEYTWILLYFSSVLLYYNKAN